MHPLPPFISSPLPPSAPLHVISFVSQSSARSSSRRSAVDDLVLLDTLSESSIVETLSSRYSTDTIYTNIGAVLIAINPFKNIKGLYEEEKIREYKGKKHYELPPHVFALADEAYSSMLSNRENQCIIISGESGAGKTETSKHIMTYISSVSGKAAEVVKVKERMLSSNPILEAFGNATTINNNNSSRFGKYMEILFDLGGDPVGGRVSNYLLEKSRVVAPSQNERSFHVFYALCAGATPQERESYYIETPDRYAYLSSSGLMQVPGIDDAADWREVIAAFRSVGISEEERQEVLRTLSICLWLGNLNFKEVKNEVAEVADRQVLEVLAYLMQVEAQQLESALCSRLIQTGVGARAEKYQKPNTAAAAAFTRDTLAKALYSRLFDWLVSKINSSIAVSSFQGVQIGVLDIYGFEIFPHNQFEQLCINYVNECLQQVFIECTLKAEQEEYANEGIPWKSIPYNDNKPLVELIGGKPGLLSLCDDACHTAKTDSMFVADLNSFFSRSVHLQCGTSDFRLKHFAGEVRYESSGFLAKNKDSLFDDLVLLLQGSRAPFVRQHGWMDIDVQEGQKKKPPTVGAIFRAQVQELMTALKACQPSYIRCIKPNQSKKPNDFDRSHVTRQVKYLGLLENIRVRRAGYAHRASFDRFIKRYGCLAKRAVSGAPRDRTLALCREFGWSEGKEFAMGKTKIFLQEAATLFSLEEALERRQDDAAATLQAAYRRYRNKKYFMQVKVEAFELVRGRKERRRNSVDWSYKGDYTQAKRNKLLQQLLTRPDGSRERLLYCERAHHMLLKGKRSMIGSMFGKKQTEFQEARLALLTDQHLYACTIELDADTRQPKAHVHFKMPLLQISHVVASPYCDNFVALHFAAQQDSVPPSVLWRLRHKTEFFALLSQAIRQLGRPMMDLRFQDSDELLVNAVKNRSVRVQWQRDDMLDSFSDKFQLVKHNVEIGVGSGLPQNQVPQSSQPPAEGAAVRGGAKPLSSLPQLKALYDYTGNSANGELSFRTGDLIRLVKDEEGGWLEGELRGSRGYVPSTYVERVKQMTPPPPPVLSRPPVPPIGMAAAPAAAAKATGPPPPPISLRPAVAATPATTGPPPFNFKAMSAASATGPPPLRPAAMATASSSSAASSGPPPVLSPVSTPINKSCAVDGCSKQRFGGKPYCAQHMASGAANQATSPVGARPTQTATAGPPPVPSRVNASVTSSSSSSSTSSSHSSSVVPPPRPFSSPRRDVLSAAVAPSRSPDVPVPRGTVHAQAANLFKGGVPMFGAPRPTQTSSHINTSSQQSAPAPPPVPLKSPPLLSQKKKQSEWTEVVDESSGATYYWNQRTQESTWTKPADM